MPNHDSELNRRYLEIDFISEFQKYWAYFNNWFKAETGTDQDRPALDTLKDQYQNSGHNFRFT